MDLNDMELPALLLTDLYKTQLLEDQIVKPPEKFVAPAASSKSKLQFLGKNQKGVCLLVNYPNDVYLPGDQLEFLTTILQACKLNLGDVAIINHYRENITFAELLKQITCNYLLIFGIDTAKLGLGTLTEFSIQNINDCCIVYSTAAEQLNNKNAESKLLKSRLWNCLKQVFNV